MGWHDDEEEMFETEEYEVFAFGDLLHVGDDNEDDNEVIAVWIGKLPWRALYEAEGLKSNPDEEVAAVIELDPTSSIPVRMGWMPFNHPYWHRASQCPLRKES